MTNRSNDPTTKTSYVRTWQRTLCEVGLEGGPNMGSVSIALIVGGDCGMNGRSKVECISGVALAVNQKAADRGKAPLRRLDSARGTETHTKGSLFPTTVVRTTSVRTVQS